MWGREIEKNCSNHLSQLNGIGAFRQNTPLNYSMRLVCIPSRWGNSTEWNVPRRHPASDSVQRLLLLMRMSFTIVLMTRKSKQNNWTRRDREELLDALRWDDKNGNQVATWIFVSVSTAHSTDSLWSRSVCPAIHHACLLFTREIKRFPKRHHKGVTNSFIYSLCNAHPPPFPLEVSAFVFIECVEYCDVVRKS